MAEPQKGASASAKPKTKSSDLDEEIGKDFFSSWKSTPVTDDDMNFDFDTAPKSKKKAFNFDKLYWPTWICPNHLRDMEFNLDSDFGKFASFEIDMPDLDFTSPHKMSANPKEKSKDEVSVGKRPKKPDSFTFSFDFNELDNFNFGSSLMKGEKTSKKEPAGKGMASNGDDCEGSDNELIQGINSLCDGILAELPAKENPANTKINISQSDACPSDSVTAKTSVLSPVQKIDNSNAKETGPGPELEKQLSISLGPKVSPQKIESNSPKETNQQSTHLEGQVCQNISQQEIEAEHANETNQPIRSQEKPVLSDLYDQCEFQDLPAQSISWNDLSQETASHMQAEFCSQTGKVDSSSVPDENINMKMTSDRSTRSGLQSKNSSLQPESDKVNLEESSDSISNEITNYVGSSQNDPGQEDHPVASRDTPHATRAGEDTENTSPKLFSVSDSKSEVCKSTGTKYREAGANRSRFFRTIEGTEPEAHLPTSTRDGGSQKSNTIIMREDLGETGSHIVRRSAGCSKSVPKESTESRLTIEPNIKNLPNVRLSVKLNAAQNARLPEKPMALREPTSIREKDTGMQPSLSRLGQQATASLNQTCTEPEPAVTSAQSAQIPKFDSEINKIVRNSADLSRLQLPRTIKAKPILSGPHENETDSLRELEQIKDLSGTTSKLVDTVGNTEKRTPLTSSLKRKIEESYADLIPLKPLKRLPEQPSESRKHREPSEQFADKQSPNPKLKNTSEVAYPTVIDHHPISEAGVSWEVNTAESEISSAMEDNGNLEKAEEYTNQLEDICNMLRKKHEEVKELLVRAIVNNNLLMLNHLIYDEKLRMVQEFATLLISKELPK